MLDWVSRNGIDRQKYAAIYASNEVMEKVAHAREMVKILDELVQRRAASGPSSAATAQPAC